LHTWDITKLKGPAKWTYFYLYVILDVYSRYAVGWTVQHAENAQVAKALIAQVCDQQKIAAGQLTVHAAEDPGDLSIAMMLGEAADQVQRVGRDPPLQSAGGLQREAQFGPCAALPLHLNRGATRVVIGGDDHLADQRAQQLLAVTIGGCLSGP
jgi:transposase InsO family protein